MSLEIILPFCCIIFLSMFIAATFGFGDAAISMPLLTLLLGAQLPIVIVAFLSLLTSSILFFRHYKRILWKDLLPLLLVALCFMPLGVYSSEILNERLMVLTLGILIILFAVYNLYIKEILWKEEKPYPLSQKNKKNMAAIGCGILSGIFGGAYNVSGPPAVLYASVAQWKPQLFSITLQGFFFVLSFFTVSFRFWKGDFAFDVFEYILIGTPIVFLATYLGEKANNKIKNPAKFHFFIQIMLLLLGFTLCFSA